MSREECETVAHCTKHGCIPKHQALDKMAENARELGLDYEQYKDAIEVSVIFHEGQKMFAVPKQPAQQEPDAIGCKCSECGAWQRWTPSGMVCKNGHGGVPGINHRLYTSPPAQRTWVGLEKSDMPDGADPLFDDPKFIAGMVYAANKLMEKNT
jgi:hypothetical protein